MFGSKPIRANGKHIFMFESYQRLKFTVNYHSKNEFNCHNLITRSLPLNRIKPYNSHSHQKQPNLLHSNTNISIRNWPLFCFVSTGCCQRTERSAAMRPASITLANLWSCTHATVPRVTNCGALMSLVVISSTVSVISASPLVKANILNCRWRAVETHCNDRCGLSRTTILANLKVDSGVSKKVRGFRLFVCDRNWSITTSNWYYISFEYNYIDFVRTADF